MDKIQVKFPYSVIASQRVEEEAIRVYDDFIAQGHHGKMQFMERYLEVRNDPRLLLDTGAKTLICFAIPYYVIRHNPIFSLHSQGLDYHWVIKRLLTPVAEAIGGRWRICVDSAPMRERYWAQRAGLGFIGKNNQLIVPGLGSYVYLAEIVTDRDLPETPHAPVTDGCGGCTRCLESCYNCALDGHKGMDARRCHSYQTIELGAESEKNPRYATVFGCDLCQRVCPYNQDLKETEIPEFRPTEHTLSITKEEFEQMSRADHKRAFKNMAQMRYRRH